MGDELETVTVTDQLPSRAGTFKRYILIDGRVIRGIDREGRVADILDFEGGIREGSIWPGDGNTLFFQSESGTVIDSRSLLCFRYELFMILL